MLSNLNPTESRLLQNTMNAMRRPQRQQTKVSPILAILDSIPNMTSTSLFAENPNDGNYCCVKCRREMLRVETMKPIQIGQDVFLRKAYVMPAACYCAAERMRNEDEMRERKERRTHLERAYKRSIMSEDLKAASFQTFQDRPGSGLVRHEALRFTQEFEQGKHGLLFYGKPGNGKSHLMASIHHELDNQGYVCLFLDCSQLFNLAKDTMNKNSKATLTDIITAAVECDLLTLDELGSGWLTEYEFNDVLFPIINGRQGKKTNYTTNLNLARLTTWFEKDKHGNPLDTDGRLIDRILGSCDIYENEATSKRQEDAMWRMQT